MSPALLKTKLIVPPKRPRVVSRPRLTAILDEALQQKRRLILVSAKAGSGKTVLISEWAHQQERPAAWLALDGKDNDPRRFFGYLFAALGQLPLTLSAALRQQLEMEQLPAAEQLMAGLVNDLAGGTSPCLLILDDYHLVQNDQIHEALAFFVEHQPAEITLILVSRVDPPLPLARFRGHGQLSEIRGFDLRFTLPESGQFLTEIMKLELTAETISALENRTEGWIVGLQMAGLSLHGRKQTEDLAAFIDTFSGTNRYILDYLMEEVLEQQPATVQNFLLETSILERMCAALCDALTAENTSSSTINSEVMLAQLERSNLFVMPLDNERRWYRYHHLFADLLRSSLQQQRPARAIRELHRRASLWYEEEDLLEEAMVHAIAAQDYERAAAMIDENIVRMLSRSEAPVLLGWIEKLPPEMAASRPWMDIYRAYTLALSGRAAEAEQVIDVVEKRIDPQTPRFRELSGEIAAIRTFTANIHGDQSRTLQMAALAEKTLPDEHLNARSMMAYALADTYFAQDDLERSSQESTKMLAYGQKLGRLLLSVTALCDLATIRKAQGQLHQALGLYREAYDLMAQRNGLDSRVRCPYEVGMADLLLEWNQLDEALGHANTGIAYGQRFNIPSLQTFGYLTRMQILMGQGEWDEALIMLQTAERHSQSFPLQLATHLKLRTMRVTFWLAAGDLEAANQAAQACSGGSELEQLALARLEIALGNMDRAQEILKKQQPAAEAGQRDGRLIEILCLQALALAGKGDHGTALPKLNQALFLAQPQGYKRLFLDLGPAMAGILSRSLIAEQQGKTDSRARMPINAGYRQEILEAFANQPVPLPAGITESVGGAQAAPGMPTDLMTEREVEVLRLLAEGISNKEIARRLVVAPSTVKQHLKHIYGKLDVHSRVQAVQRGQELGLL